MTDSTTPSETTTAKLVLENKTFEFPTLTGSEGEKAIDISQLRGQTRYITMDDGYGNTGSCQSAITFINGEEGILRYRGYPIEQLAENSSFVETAYLLIYGELPKKEQLKRFSEMLTEYEMIHEALKYHFEGFPPAAHPMPILSAMINAMGSYHNDIMESDEQFDKVVARLISKVRTIAAFSHKKSIGQPFIYPHPDFSYCANLLHMMFSVPYREYAPDIDIVRAMNLILILHADHEQNCSTSTVRMVASSRANLYASIAAGVCALWGPLHGGANMAVIRMLEEINNKYDNVQDYIDKVKDSTNSIRLMGFGHRVYKYFDPRAKILKKACDRVLAKLGIEDHALDIAKQLEEAALNDEYFVKRNLYPNVDFYSGIIMRAIGIPLDMFTVMFAIGRMPGWIANWHEVWQNPKARIYRPRQIYTGQTSRDYISIEERD